jgi:hypothetical protein
MVYPLENDFGHDANLEGRSNITNHGVISRWPQKRLRIGHRQLLLDLAKFERLSGVVFSGLSDFGPATDHHESTQRRKDSKATHKEAHTETAYSRLESVQESCRDG